MKENIGYIRSRYYQMEVSASGSLALYQDYYVNKLHAKQAFKDEMMRRLQSGQH